MHCYSETVVIHIQYQVLTHHGQSNQSNIRFWFHG